MKKTLKQKLRPGKLPALCLWGGLIIACFIYRDELTVESIVGYTPDSPVLAAAVMMGLFALKGSSMLVNGNILFTAAGVLFSLPGAVAVNTAGAVIMTSIPFFIGRKGGAEAMEALTRKYKKLELLREVPRRGEFSFTFFLRIMGMLPCEPVGIYLGACGIRYGRYMAGTVLGLAPAIVSFAVMGEYAAEPASPQFFIAAGVEVGTTVCALAAAFIYKLRKKRMDNR